jgi:hypothetical protein
VDPRKLAAGRAPALLAVILAGCDMAVQSEAAAPASPLCVPGRSIACTGPAGCGGYQVCAPDSRSFGACECPAPGALLVPPVLSPPADDHVLAFASGPDWASYAGTVSTDAAASYVRADYMGPARSVCVSASMPPGCPRGAVIYGHPGTAWSGGAGIPDARWIWRGDVQATAPAAFQTAIFEKTFTLGARPTGVIRVAGDDFARVFVNGVAIGATGSVVYVGEAWRAQSTLAEMDLTPALRAGENTLTVAARNGPFNCDSAACTYVQNPAGVVFAGTLRW